MVGDLVAKVVGRGEFDLLHDVLYELPMTVICELLGASGDERAMFAETFSQQSHEVADVGSATPEQRGRADRNVEVFTENVKQMIERHRSAPADDILTTLIQASEDGDRLGEDEVIAAIYILIGAGLYQCLGIHLARMEMQIALDTLVRRIPGLRLVGEPEWRPTWMMRGLQRMPAVS